ncbi:short-chain dehydrogenase/oxidoreductase [Lactiplantibacillus plantarum]|nr:short-chain dehydrogenase/oxidoreductase [Lactiplantibacillus plantarum]
MEMGLAGKRVLVTGSTKGIGRAIAVAFAKEGADVVINGRRTDTVAAVVDELAAAYPTTHPVAAPYDISDPQQADKMFQQIPTVDYWSTIWESLGQWLTMRLTMQLGNASLK